MRPASESGDGTDITVVSAGVKCCSRCLPYIGIVEKECTVGGSDYVGPCSKSRNLTDVIIDSVGVNRGGCCNPINGIVKKERCVKCTFNHLSQVGAASYPRQARSYPYLG